MGCGCGWELGGMGGVLLAAGCLLHRDIRKALAALARELNDSEGKRLEVEGALRSAGGGLGLAEARGTTTTFAHIRYRALYIYNYCCNIFFVAIFLKTFFVFFSKWRFFSIVFVFIFFFCFGVGDFFLPSRILVFVLLACVMTIGNTPSLLRK